VLDQNIYEGKVEFNFKIANFFLKFSEGANRAPIKYLRIMRNFHFFVTFQDWSTKGSAKIVSGLMGLRSGIQPKDQIEFKTHLKNRK
jgi:hypothetical protein